MKDGREATGTMPRTSARQTVDIGELARRLEAIDIEAFEDMADGIGAVEWKSSRCETSLF